MCYFYTLNACYMKKVFLSVFILCLVFSVNAQRQESLQRRLAGSRDVVGERPGHADLEGRYDANEESEQTRD